MYRELSELLIAGRFDEAEILCNDIDADEIADIMLRSAYETESITVYGFAAYM